MPLPADVISWSNDAKAFRCGMNGQHSERYGWRRYKACHRSFTTMAQWQAHMNNKCHVCGDHSYLDKRGNSQSASNITKHERGHDPRNYPGVKPTWLCQACGVRHRPWGSRSFNLDRLGHLGHGLCPGQPFDYTTLWQNPEEEILTDVHLATEGLAQVSATAVEGASVEIDVHAPSAAADAGFATQPGIWSIPNTLCPPNAFSGTDLYSASQQLNGFPPDQVLVNPSIDTHKELDWRIDAEQSIVNHQPDERHRSIVYSECKDVTNLALE
ncbi:hypothetical protein NliqN6_2313 [Naganishia liquefaciens]|uniref:Uncharacterized protein n=1 Tax=Naganishia liquefaciens TaxID=104408 RepID=A0A8H3TS09_9TREE|nr:hypothetical protein NliqN6_2313 [Naganishia liquefaciens]